MPGRRPPPASRAWSLPGKTLMPKTSLEKRHGTDVIAYHAERLAEAGLTDAVAQEAVEVLVNAMRSAMTPRDKIDYTTRQRSAMYLLDLWAARRVNGNNAGSDASPLVVLNLGTSGGLGGEIQAIDAPLT